MKCNPLDSSWAYDLGSENQKVEYNQLYFIILILFYSILFLAIRILAGLKLFWAWHNIQEL